jgi:chemotaxis protein methyltransferase CheR
MTSDIRLLFLRLRRAVPADPYTSFLRWTLPRLGKRWAGYRRVQGQIESRLTDRLQALGLRGLGDHLKAHPGEWKRLDAMCRIGPPS